MHSVLHRDITLGAVRRTHMFPDPTLGLHIRTNHNKTGLICIRPDPIFESGSLAYIYPFTTGVAYVEKDFARSLSWHGRGGSRNGYSHR